MKKIFFSFAIFCILFAVPSVLADENLLLNPGFEDGDTNWQSYPSTAQFTIADVAKEGSHSASLTKTTSSSYAYIFQRTDIEAKKQYKLSGSVLVNDAKIDNTKLKLFFLDDSDNRIASSEAIIQTHSTDWQSLETPDLIAPDQAKKVEIQAYVYLNDKNPTQPALFDDLRLYETPIVTPTTVIAISPTPTSQSLKNIFISEVMAYPETGQNEWFEIYNDNDFTAHLVNWYIDDAASTGSSPKTFSLDINPKSYASYDLSSSMFNNDGDSVRLLDDKSNLIDSFDYADAVVNTTLGKTNVTGGTICIQEPSRNAANNSCLSPTATPAPTSVPTPTNMPTKPPTATPVVLTTMTIPKTFPINQNSKFNLQPSPVTASVNTSKKQHTQNKELVLGTSTHNFSSMQKTAIVLLSVALLGITTSALSISIKRKDSIHALLKRFNIIA